MLLLAKISGYVDCYESHWSKLTTLKRPTRIKYKQNNPNPNPNPNPITGTIPPPPQAGSTDVIQRSSGMSKQVNSLSLKYPSPAPLNFVLLFFLLPPFVANLEPETSHDDLVKIRLQTATRIVPVTYHAARTFPDAVIAPKDWNETQFHKFLFIICRGLHCCNVRSLYSWPLRNFWCLRYNTLSSVLSHGYKQ